MIEIDFSDIVQYLTVTADLTVEGNIDLVHADKKLNLPIKNDAVNPTVNFGGNNGFYERDSTTIGISLNGIAYWQINTNYIGLEAPNYPVLRREASSATNPNLLPAYDDPDTGIGHASADALSLIAGGVEGHRITEAAGAITHVLTDDVGITGDLDVDGDLNVDGIVKTPSAETIDTNGAISITTALTYMDTLMNNEGTFTLPDGTVGQEKYLLLIARIAVDAVITPTNLWNGTTITFDTIGETIHLKFMSGKWTVMGGTATVA